MTIWQTALQAGFQEKAAGLTSSGAENHNESTDHNGKWKTEVRLAGVTGPAAVALQRLQVICAERRSLEALSGAKAPQQRCP